MCSNDDRRLDVAGKKKKIRRIFVVTWVVKTLFFLKLNIILFLGCIMSNVNMSSLKLLESRDGLTNKQSDIAVGLRWQRLKQRHVIRPREHRARDAFTLIIWLPRVNTLSFSFLPFLLVYLKLHSLDYFNHALVIEYRRSVMIVKIKDLNPLFSNYHNLCCSQITTTYFQTTLIFNIFLWATVFDWRRWLDTQKTNRLSFGIPDIPDQRIDQNRTVL